MNFISDKEDLGKIIKKYKVNGNNYHIDYMDGSESNFFCSNENYDKELRDIMIKQAIERQKEFDLKTISKQNLFNTILLLVNLSLMPCFINNNDSTIIALSILILVAIIYKRRKNKKQIKELKKYKMFLEMINDIEYINNAGVLKCIEFENIYQKPFDIDTLDEYSYSDVKTIYKKVKKQ